MIRIRALRRGAAVAAVALLPAISGCGGLLSSSMVETVENPAAGSIAKTGSMLVRNAFVLGPAPDERIPRGGRAAVYVSLFNRGSGSGQADVLVSASAGKSAESVRISGGRVEVPPRQLVNVTLDEGKLILHDLTRPLSGGESITLTLTFAESGTTTLDVPVLPHTGPYETLTPFPSSPPPPAQPGQSPASSPTSTPAGTSSPAASPNQT